MKNSLFHISLRCMQLLFAIAVLPVSLLSSEIDAINTGDTAWMLTATVLVLFMTIPGLSLFYGGLVRNKNVLSVLMQCFATVGLITVLCVIYGYSLAFTDGGGLNKFVGGLSKAFNCFKDSMYLTIAKYSPSFKKNKIIISSSKYREISTMIGSCIMVKNKNKINFNV